MSRIPSNLTDYVRKRSDARSILVVATHTTFVLSPVYFAAASEPGWWSLAFWLWFGLLGHGLTNLMHEAAHRLVLRSGPANDFLGRWFLAPLFLTDFEHYRQRHWQHHRRVGEDDDTKDAYLAPIRGWRILGLVAGSVLLKNAAGLLLKGAPGGARPGNHPRSFRLAPLVVFQSLFLGSLATVALITTDWSFARAWPRAAAAYGFVYLYGAASLTVLIAALRSISEHQIFAPCGTVTGRAALRNLKSSPLTRLLFGCYGFAEHASHHLEPAVPYYRLGELTEELARNDESLLPTESYFSLLHELVRSGSTELPARDRRAVPGDSVPAVDD